MGINNLQISDFCNQKQPVSLSKIKLMNKKLFPLCLLAMIGTTAALAGCGQKDAGDTSSGAAVQQDPNGPARAAAQQAAAKQAAAQAAQAKQSTPK